MNRFKLILIFGITGIIIILFFSISFFLGKTPVSQEQNNNLTTPTQIPFNTNGLYITSIIPENTTQTYIPVQPVQITFTKPVSISSLKYQITPDSKTYVTEGKTPNSLVISPSTFWGNGKTTITILSTTTSSSGLKLKNPQSYVLKTAAPTIPANLEGAY